MIDPARHVPLRPLPWSDVEARRAIDDIAADAIAHFDSHEFWPAHPLDGERSDAHTSFYFGASGMIWALDYLGRAGAAAERFDVTPFLSRLMEASQSEQPNYQDYAAHGSLLFGDMGTALLIMRLAPSAAVADLVHARASANDALPVRELMWGTPGSMMACVHMAAMTGEPRWRTLFAAQAARLLGELEQTGQGLLWTQDLYGRSLRYLGPVHGYAGNMIALLAGWQWLTGAQRALIADAVPQTLAATAHRSELGAAWPAALAQGNTPPFLCQHCHGAPGMVTAFADAPFSSPELEELLREGGKLTWAAGPLAKGGGLCHGTGGNGYAFLKLYRRTGDTVWLERARAFAMMAVAQYREATQQFGRGRYSLWTGDVGLAVYLWDCLRGVPQFPAIDVF